MDLLKGRLPNPFSSELSPRYLHGGDQVRIGIDNLGASEAFCRKE